MARPRAPLDPTYGKLTVLQELPGNEVKVRCVCGTEKSVHRSNLRAGRVTSCGGEHCREAPARGPRARGPSWITHDLIPKLFTDLRDGELLVADVATHYGIHEQTVYALLHTIDAAGGIDAYMAGLRPPQGAATLPSAKPKDPAAPPPAPKPKVKAPPPVRSASPAGVPPPPPPARWEPKKA